jgi:hypothetical protein
MLGLLLPILESGCPKRGWTVFHSCFTLTSSVEDTKRSVSISCAGFSVYCDETAPVRYFPHEVADLLIILDYMLAPTSPVKDPSNWSLRYAILLWLSLVCMIPFDLAQFDDRPHSGQTAQAVESLAKGFLGNPGLEREAASILLSRLYMRCVKLQHLPYPSLSVL